jgi:protein tyrosine/serine phosphatase
MTRLALLPLLIAGAAAGCKDKPETAEPMLVNFHVIEEGKAYRSPQLSAESLAWVIDHHGIKTVINLRGPNPDEPWYRDESSVCKAKQTTLVDLPMSSQSLPAPELLKSILSALKTAQPPVLIHCESGADRTGAAAALYRMEVLGQDRATALRELSPDYWHFRSKKPCMDTLVEMYEPTPEWMARYEKDYQNITCK